MFTATETGESSIVTDDINSNDVTSHDYLTTSSSITPVKLQTVTFSSPEGTTSEDTVLLSSAATGRTTGGGSTGPSVTHHNTVEGLRQEPSMNDFAGWKDADALGNLGSSEVESSSDKTDALLHREYEFKSGFPELRNETREALQEEGSNHQPVVFVGGSGYVPPNSLRTRPSLEADPLWQARPLAESRYPVPLQSAWDRNYRNPFNMTRVQHIEAECQDDFMKIRVLFNGSFHGLIYSSGYSYDPDCVYVNGTGRDGYDYLIKLNRCGTLGASNHVEGRREPSKNFMWNTVTVQYNPMIEEEWDEHFKVTCEYGYDFWKTVTFPFLDVEVATGNPVVFTLTPPECYMEVRYGFGTSGTRVGGPVRVGDPLTLMINMRSQYDGFDIVVNDCYAHNGATKKIQLIDHYGCPVDSKLMSPFRGTWSHTNLYETQVYAYLKTFRFTGSPALYIECDVRMCHGQCPSQPCYWRNVKSVSKRSTDNQMMITDSEKNSTLSENLSLFQALRVLQEDEDTEALKSNLDTHESVCMKTGAFTAMIGLSTFILVILTVSTMIMCFRMRRTKIIEERETATDILRPYSHHVSSSQQSQHQHPHQHHHHWSSAKPR
ncbi:Cuticlin-1 [Orchesella cincta]|uniref:Cuticlin-1 n=1 Tax=Orchesella cincta TaxID=48709 RepID=A0A1D2MF73_ORCCI|nr:Cuticlin-1 [Orchesella cincta]